MADLVSPREADTTASQQALSRIADALSVPVVALYDHELLPTELAYTAELVSLYLALKSETARARVLAEARAAVAAQSSHAIGYPDR